uniref:Cation efflux protein transmembrane domain-containing protein n=1 Tax=Globodera rostochiensis TaxID=31243 RepID=A0A914I4X2_GLORO
MQCTKSYRDIKQIFPLQNLISECTSVLIDPVSQKACLCFAASAFLLAFLIYSVSATRSLVLTGLAWLGVFSLFVIFSTIVAFISAAHRSANKRYTFDMARAPVLAVFSTTVLAQLSAVFLAKEAVERLFDSGQHHHSHHGGDAAALTGGDIVKTDHLFYPAAFASASALLIVAYALANQPFNYVLKHAQSSVIQEHSADICAAICYFVPGLARLLLPRINSLTLLAFISACCAVFVHWFRAEFPWVDSAATMALSFTIFTSMAPLSSYTGRILLQTTPPHVQNLIDRSISEASTVDGVLELINTHFWQLDFNTIVGTVDVRVRRDADEQTVLRTVRNKLSSVVNYCTVQVLKDSSTGWAYHRQYQSPLYQPSTTASAHSDQSATIPHTHDHHSNDHHQHHGHGHGHSHH